MGIEYAEKMTKKKPVGSSDSRSALDHMREWKKTKADLLRRADDLKKRATQLKLKDPSLSDELMKRATVLTDEAAAMSKGGKHGLTTQQIRRASILGWLALLKDKR